MNLVYNISMKSCNTCGLDLPETDFFKRTQSIDGLAYKCKKCLKKYMADWRANNKDKMQVQHERWLEHNYESYIERQRKYQRENRQKMRDSSERYRKNNRSYFSNWKKVNADKVRHYAKTRRLRLLEVEWSFYTTKQIYDRDNGMCGICNKLVEFDVKAPNPLSPSVDHIKPLVKGGTDTLDNIQIAHLGCNLRKGATYDE